MPEKSGHGWIQKARKKSARSPGWRGAVTIDGREYHLSGWLKADKFGRPMLSLAVTRRPGDEKTKQTGDENGEKLTQGD